MKARMNTPRVAPLAPEEWPEAHKPLLQSVYESGQVYNNIGTLARHPEAFDRVMAWGEHVMKRSTLEPREREIIILRTGWLSRSQYVWEQHRVIGLRDGLSSVEIDAIAEGSKNVAWSEGDRSLLHAAEELFEDSFISDDTWAALISDHSLQQLMDIVFAAGTYSMMASLLNSLGVQLDESFDATNPETLDTGINFKK